MINLAVLIYLMLFYGWLQMHDINSFQLCEEFARLLYIRDCGLVILCLRRRARAECHGG